jgi:acetyl esterase/lipase
MKQYFFSKVLLLFACLTLNAQDQVIPLWTGVAPGSENWTQEEVHYLDGQQRKMIRNVSVPSITVYRPDPSYAVKAAVIIAPGGGFRFLSWQNEGTEVAEWLVSRGVTAFVLKYRLIDTGSTNKEFQAALMALFQSISRASNPENAGKPESDISLDPDMVLAAGFGVEDGKQAIRIIRSRSEEWDIDPEKIGILGFSAGGILASRLLFDQDKESCPDFGGLIYTPWSGGPIPKDAPPVFIAVANDDVLASPGSLRMYTAGKEAGIEVELHVYNKGGHGFGMQQTGRPSDKWIEQFWDWMNTMD